MRAGPSRRPRDPRLRYVDAPQGPSGRGPSADAAAAQLVGLHRHVDAAHATL